MSLRETNNANGVVTQILCFRDMTHEVQVERLKTEFLTTAAHELRTPLTGIYGYSEMLLHGRLDETARQEAIGQVHQQAKRLVSVLADMLELTQFEAGHGLRIHWQPLSLRDLVVSRLAGFQPPAGRTAPVLERSGSDLPTLGDADKIGRAVSTVLSNAYKYSENTGAIRVTLVDLAASEDTAAMVGVRIADAGVGMSPAELVRVGERFFRADPSGKRLGIGLGMILVKEIVALHNGQMDIASQPGVGTTVTLWFPMRRTC